MAFWGSEVRSGKPRTLSCSSDNGRFHLTQATLGISVSDKDETKGSYVQCNVGDRPGVLICSLFPGKTNTCSLNLQFDEDEEVVFSVLGPNSVHLCGFFEERNPDEYGEDITEENSEDEEEEEEDMSDDDDGFIVADDDSEEDAMIVSPGMAPNSGVKIEEIEIEDEVGAEKEDTQKAKKKDKKKKKKEEDKKTDQEEQETVLPENNGKPEGNGIEKEEGNGEGNRVNGDNEEVSVHGKRKKKSKEYVKGEAEAEAEPPTKKQATEEAVIGVTEAAQVKTSKKKKKSKKKAKDKGDAPEE